MKEYIRKYRRIIMMLWKLLLIVGTISIFVVYWTGEYPETLFFRRGNYFLVLGYGLMLFIFMHIYGGIRLGGVRVGEVIYSNCLASMITNIFMYMQLCMIGEGMLDPIPMVMATLIQMVFQGGVCSGMHRFYFRYNTSRDVLIVGEKNERLQEIIQNMKKIGYNYQILEVEAAQEWIAYLEDIIEYPQAVIIVQVNNELKEHLLEVCYKKEKEVYIVPTMKDIIVHTATPTQIFDTPLLYCKNEGMTPNQKLIKRTMDMLLALIGIMVAVPIMMIITICIKLEDGGTIFYKQKRVTKGNQVFEMYKLRSMVVNAEEDGVARLASQGDRRITKVGRWIRLMRLDEMPQLVNVLKGEMSIVGPRPERPELIEQYQKVYPNIIYRTRVKAGLTGLAQVKGKYNTTIEDKLFFDLLYIQQYSVWSDIKIIFMTIKVLFMAESTEGVESNEKIDTEKEAMQQSIKEVG